MVVAVIKICVCFREILWPKQHNLDYVEQVCKTTRTVPGQVPLED